MGDYFSGRERWDISSDRLLSNRSFFTKPRITNETVVAASLFISMVYQLPAA
jgi:hypothetical protein